MPSSAFTEMMPKNGDATSVGFQSKRQSSTRKYRCLTVLFGILNVVWIILLSYMITALNRHEEPYNSSETHQTGARAESMCLPCSYLGQSESTALCCADSLEVWRNYVTAFVNVEFARSKRSPEGKAEIKSRLPGLPNKRRKRAVDDEAYYHKRRQEGANVLLSKQVDQTGSYIITAEVTLDFLNSNKTSSASCSIVRVRKRVIETSFVLFNETVSACYLKSPKDTCKAPISIGGNSFLEAGDRVYLEIDRLQELVNVITKVLTVV